jgi:predicted RND superfamily exporter protein
VVDRLYHDSLNLAQGVVKRATIATCCQWKWASRGGLYAFLGIFFLVIVTFRAVQPIFLALVPLVVGSLWTLGLIGVLQIEFNVANLLVLPLIMTPAVESGIMIVYRACVEGERSLLTLPLPQSTGRAVGFSAQKSGPGVISRLRLVGRPLPARRSSTL